MNGLSSTSTQLVRDRAYWTQVIHNAARVSPDDPRYAASRVAAQQAIQGLRDWADAAADKDTKALAPSIPATAAVAFGHGASLGLAGDPAYLQLARETNPKTALAGDIAGTGALAGIAAPLVAGLSPAVGGAVLGGTLGGARGAIEPIPGLSRTESAALSGVGGAVTGAVLGKFVAKLTPAIRTVVANAQRLIGTGIAPADAEALTEAAVRSRLAQYNLAPDVLERAVQSWKANGELSVRASGTPTATSASPIAVRPGETLTPILPQLRAAADPLDQPAYMRTGNPRGLPTGTGRTLPYYPRGGAAEQAMPPRPATSPPASLAGNQQAVFADFLRGATPQDLGTRLATLRSLGVPLPATAEPDLLAVLLRGAQ